MEYLRGNISMTHLVGWGVSITLALGGMFWTKIGMTDSKVSELSGTEAKTIERVATVEEAVRTIKSDNAEIKADVKTLLQRTK